MLYSVYQYRTIELKRISLSKKDRSNTRNARKTHRRTNEQIFSNITTRRVSKCVKMSKPKSLAFAKYIFYDSTETSSSTTFRTYKPEPRPWYKPTLAILTRRDTCSVFKTLSFRNLTCIVAVAAYVRTPIVDASYTINNKNTVTNEKKIEYFRFPPSTRSARTYLMSPPLAGNLFHAYFRFF